MSKAAKKDSWRKLGMDLAVACEGWANLPGSDYWGVMIPRKLVYRARDLRASERKRKGTRHAS